MSPLAPLLACCYHPRVPCWSWAGTRFPGSASGILS